MKKLWWLGSTRKALKAMPRGVRAMLGYGLYLAGIDRRHAQAKPLRGLNMAGTVEIGKRSGNGALRAIHIVKLGDSIYVFDCFKRKETQPIVISDMDLAQSQLKAARAHAEGSHEEDGIEAGGIEESAGNIYADLGMDDADQMLIKAQLVTKIGEIIKRRKWSQQQASELLGIPPAKLSKMLHGQFRNIAEATLLDCLTRLGRDVQIIIGPARRNASAGRVAVVFTP